MRQIHVQRLKQYLINWCSKGRKETTKVTRPSIFDTRALPPHGKQDHNGNPHKAYRGQIVVDSNTSNKKT
jgi:hypothetical protein